MCYCMFVCLYVSNLPAGRWFCHSAEWSSLSPSGRFLSGHWSQNLCRTSACPVTAKVGQHYSYELVCVVSLLSYKNVSRHVDISLGLYCTWQKRCPSFSLSVRLDRWQLTTKWESSNMVLNQRLVGSRAWMYRTPCYDKCFRCGWGQPDKIN